MDHPSPCTQVLDLAALVGLDDHRWYTLINALKEGRLPLHRGGIAVDWAECVRQLRALHKSVSVNGVSEYAALERMLRKRPTTSGVSAIGSATATLPHTASPSTSSTGSVGGDGGAAEGGQRKKSKAALASPLPPPNLLDWSSEPDELRRSLMRYFGHEGFHSDDNGEWQRTIIEAALSGKDTVVGRATGAGKSLCFQLPAIIHAQRTSEKIKGGSSTAAFKTAVVVSPLVALMKDQVAQLNAAVEASLTTPEERRDLLGIPNGDKFATLLGVGQADKLGAERQVREGKVRMVYVTEKLIFDSLSFRGTLQQLHQEGKLLMMAVDEAHLVVEWVQSAFRASYGRLGELRRDMLPGLPLMALSAVPTPQMWRDVRSSLLIDEGAATTHSTIFRNNLNLSARYRMAARSKTSTRHCLGPIADDLANEQRVHGRPEPTIVYTHRVKGVKNTADSLRQLLDDDERGPELRRKVRIAEYFGDQQSKDFREKGDEERQEDYTRDRARYREEQRTNLEKRAKQKEQDQRDFMSSNDDLSVMVANDAFGMGINHSGVRRIVHYGEIKSAEAFYNQFGRAGRDNKPAECVLICNSVDLTMQEANIRTDRQQKRISWASAEAQLASVQALREYVNNTTTCRWCPLLRHWGQLEPEEAFSCDKCDNCERGETEPYDFTEVATVCLRMFKVALVGGNQSASLSKVDLERTLSRHGNTNEADAARKRLLMQWRMWTIPNIIFFIEFLADQTDQPLIKRDTGKSGSGERRQFWVRYSLTQAGVDALRRLDLPGAVPFKLVLPPPLFVIECDEGRRELYGSDDEGASDGEGEEGVDLSDAEIEDELPEGQSSITKDGEQMYIPECGAWSRSSAAALLPLSLAFFACLFRLPCRCRPSSLLLC